MSKTDKTNPYWVKVCEHYVEVHNHANGRCEIAGKRPSKKTVGWRRYWKCYFNAQTWRPEYRCGCELCGIPQIERRRTRYAARRVERDWWKETLRD